MEVPAYVRQQAQFELARRDFYEYCRVMYPRFYGDDKPYLEDICHRVQWFIEQSSKHFLVITVPPRHFKSFTATNLVEWYFGKRPDRKVMTGSYNETLSTTFARKVRDTITEKISQGSTKPVYAQIFPDTKVKYGQSSASLWALEGSSQDNYLATSPTGTATGFGTNVLLIDDIIKNAEEAYNDAVLDKHWSWFTNTMLSRTEGDDWKVIAIMTRWSTQDLAGRILERFGEDVEHISYSAMQEDGSMLCDAVLTRDDFELKTQEMNPDIVDANYNQKPVDVKGKLYPDLMTYESLPAGEHRKFNYTDTADKGTDFLCSIDYIVHEGDVYVTNLVFSDEPMEVTEPLVANMFAADEVDEADIESNNGGRGFGRNIERILREQLQYLRCVVNQLVQTGNKEARILASSAWVLNHVYMPPNWKQKHAAFYRHVTSYQKKGKNAHDDGPDVLAGIFERVTGKVEVEYGGLMFG